MHPTPFEDEGNCCPIWQDKVGENTVHQETQDPQQTAITTVDYLGYEGNHTVQSA